MRIRKETFAPTGVQLGMSAIYDESPDSPIGKVIWIRPMIEVVTIKYFDGSYVTYTNTEAPPQ